MQNMDIMRFAGNPFVGIIQLPSWQHIKKYLIFQESLLTANVVGRAAKRFGFTATNERAPVVTSRCRCPIRMRVRRPRSDRLQQARVSA